MTTCANCGRPVPCGCPNPVRADAALTSLFGLVCDRCDGYNDPGRDLCVLCGAPLNTPAASGGAAATPLPLESAPLPLTPAVAAQATPPAPAPKPVAPIALSTPAPVTTLPRPSSPTSQLPVAPPPAPVAAPAAAAPAARPAQPAPLPLRLDQPVVPQVVPTAAPAAPRAAGPLPLTNVVESSAAVCPRCSARSPSEFRFCTECGMALRPDTVAPAKSTALPVAIGRAATRVLRGERLGQTLPVGVQATAGRAQGPLSFAGDPFLAPLHCTLYFQQNRLFVRDEGSPSGTFVRLRDEEPLAPGDFFAIGDHLLRYLGPLAPEMTAADGTRVFGCPRPPGAAVQLEEIHEGGVPGRIHTRLGPSIIIGRDDGCDLSFAGDPFVSGRHTNLTIGAGGRARVRDMGSTNGTFRRLEPNSERELLRGDCVRIGSEVLQIVETAAPVLTR